VVGAHVTGYAAVTGTPDKGSTFATGSVALAQLAGRVMQLQQNGGKVCAKGNRLSRAAQCPHRAEISAGRRTRGAFDYRICPALNIAAGMLCSDSKPVFVTRTHWPNWTPAFSSFVMTLGWTTMHIFSSSTNVGG
jgi:hypothetical protein